MRKGFDSWPVPNAPLEIFRERKWHISSTASSLLLLENQSQWFSCVRNPS